MYSQSQKLFEKSQQIIPGGVNSPVRAFGSVGGKPIFIQSAKGAYLKDADGNQYIDFINSWGPMILGHGFEPVVEAVKEQADRGFSYGAPTELELQLAQQIITMAPQLDKVRLVNSGTEACMSALRLARGYTGKDKFIKFAGNYHGHADPFLVKAGSGLLSFGIPGSAGVPKGATDTTLIANYNDLANVEAIFKEHGEDLAAVILEPNAGNMGCIPPSEGFLQGLRKLCSDYGVVLIFDEVMTGFRLAPGGATERFNVLADLYCYGKVIGGGMPLAAFGGRNEIMDYLAPNGPVYQAGTLSGNPLAVSSGLATLKYLHEHSELYTKLETTTKTIAKVLQDAFKNEQHVVNQEGSMVSIHFGTDRIQNYEDAQAAKNSRFNELFHFLLGEGIYLPPSAFETWFISKDIGENEIEKLADVLNKFTKA